MANEQTSVPLFVADTILTAAQQNISAGTGVPVFATTVTRDAAFGGANKALAEGQLCYLSATNVVQYYDGSAWATVGPAAAATSGLTFITGATFTTATTVSLPASTFTSTYRNYKIIFQITATSADANITMRLRAAGTDISTANYDVAFVGLGNDATAQNSGSIAATSWTIGQVDSGLVWNVMDFDVIAPQVATNTFITGQYAFVETTGTTWIARNGSAVFRLTTSVDALSVISSVASSISGVYRVYGYSES